MDLRLPAWLLVLGTSLSCSDSADPCAALNRSINTGHDVSLILSECLERVAAGGQLSLPAGVYTLKRPIIIDKPVTLATANLKPTERGCADLPVGSCATLQIIPANRWSKPNSMPIHVLTDGVRLSHIVVRGTGVAGRQRSYCRSSSERPLGGGIRVSGSDFILHRSVLRDVACYSALEITSGALRPVVTDNVIGPNGDHRPGEIWADGVTVHDTSGALIVGNRFIDNTDVQLILGGCRGCRIENNRFRHSGTFSGSSFAELMLHAWPSTSGDYSGTLVRGNDVDCGPRRRCGYGIMIGSAPWYDAPMAGGTIMGNRVSNAMIGLNIDTPSGPVEIHGNAVSGSGGVYGSDCGVRRWPAANVAPGSHRFIVGDPSDQWEGSISTSGCLLNRHEQ